MFHWHGTPSKAIIMSDPTVNICSILLLFSGSTRKDPFCRNKWLHRILLSGPWKWSIKNSNHIFTCKLREHFRRIKMCDRCEFVRKTKIEDEDLSWFSSLVHHRFSFGRLHSNKGCRKFKEKLRNCIYHCSCCPPYPPYNRLHHCISKLVVDFDFD